MASVFSDKNGILLVDYLGKGATITEKCYVAFLGSNWSANIKENV
jgi:hypothetical protein